MAMRLSLRSGSWKKFIFFRNSHQTSTQVKLIEESLEEQRLLSPNTNFRKIATCLIDFGVNSKNLIPYFKNRPELINTQSSHWNETIKFFSTYDCTINETMSIISENPGILYLSNEHLLKTFICLQNQGIQNKKLIRYIQDNPHVLKMTLTEISEKIDFIRTIFTNKDTQKIVNSSPNILIESNDEISTKIQYLLKMCAVEHAQMVNANALKYPLQHIYIRHEFLCRTGHYDKPKSSRKICKNPPLKLIFGSDDEYFATKIAKVNLNEFRVFCQLNEHEKYLNDFVWGIELIGLSDDEN